MNTNKIKPLREYVAAPPGELYWRHEKCPHPGAKVLLLTKGNVCHIGTWRGEVGDFFLAWCPLPKDEPPPSEHLKGNGSLIAIQLINNVFHKNQMEIADAPLLQRLRFAFRLIFQPRA